MSQETPAEQGTVLDEEATEFEHRFEIFGEVVRSARSASAAVAWWTDEGLPEINVIATRDRVLTLPEYKTLDGKHHNRGHERLGLLRSGGPRQQVVAWTKAVVLPDRLPASVRMRLGIAHPDNPGPAAATGEPIGVVLAELGTRAARVDTTVTSILGRQDAVGCDLVYACTGVWVVDGVPAVQVVEEFLRSVIENFAPPGRLERFRQLGDKLVGCEENFADRCLVSVDQGC